jgi:hypothetical protein
LTTGIIDEPEISIIPSKPTPKAIDQKSVVESQIIDAKSATWLPRPEGGGSWMLSDGVKTGQKNPSSKSSNTSRKPTSGFIDEDEDPSANPPIVPPSPSDLKRLSELVGKWCELTTTRNRITFDISVTRNDATVTGLAPFGSAPASVRRDGTFIVMRDPGKLWARFQLLDSIRLDGRINVAGNETVVSFLRC